MAMLSSFTPMEDTLIPSSLQKLSRHSKIATTVNSKPWLLSILWSCQHVSTLVTCASSVTVKAHYSRSLQASQVKIILSWLSRQGIYKSSKRKEQAQSQHGLVDKLKFKKTTLLICMPKSQPLKLHYFLRIKSPSHCLKPNQLLRSVPYLWQKSWTNNNTGHHLYDLQPMVSRKAYQNSNSNSNTKACMEGKQNLKSIDSKRDTAS